MFALPLPILEFLLASLACALIWRVDFGNQLARNLFTTHFALIAFASLMVGLRFGYGFEGLIKIQRLVPLFIGPLLFLGFKVMTIHPKHAQRLILYHLGIALIGALSPLIVSQLFADSVPTQIFTAYDVLILISYLFYSIALFMLWRKGADNLSHARLDITRALRKWILAGAILLLAMLLIDGVIALGFAFEKLGLILPLITIGSLLGICAIVGVIYVLSRSNNSEPTEHLVFEEAPRTSNKLEMAARDLLEKNELFLDTELTIDRLAKRLHVPSRSLSEAINARTGENISQYVNGFRVRYAQRLLRETDLSAVKIGEQSGFLARSNFYREFQRVLGETPVEYRSRMRS